MLPGLTPAHTRSSFHSASSPESTGSRLSVEKYASTPEDFIISEATGLWLLPLEIAEKDIDHDISRADWLASRLEHQDTAKIHSQKFRQIARLLGRSTISESGCVVNGLRGRQKPADIAITLAEFEMGAGSHNTPTDIPHISLCGNEDCYNSRHHNLDFGGARKDMQKLDLNPHWYKTRNDGSIETIWGDKLPPLETSLREFIKFQRMNYPFVPYKESPLTSTPISQIAIHPLTGCWESYMYEKNTAGLANMKNGYGVMYARKEPDTIDPITGEVKPGYRRGSVLAHNLIWTVMGNTLSKDMDRNHLCNYPRCCNPLHLEQITPDENRRHGHMARACIRLFEKSNPDLKDASLTKEETGKLFLPIKQTYRQIVS